MAVRTDEGFDIDDAKQYAFDLRLLKFARSQDLYKRQCRIPADYDLNQMKDELKDFRSGMVAVMVSCPWGDEDAACAALTNDYKFFGEEFDSYAKFRNSRRDLNENTESIK